MHEQVSGLKNSGVYFFRGDFEQILSGVVLDYVPRGVYIYDFRFPLFDFAGTNLTYSDRLHGNGFIGKGEMSERDIVSYIMASQEVRNIFGANAPLSLSAFVQYLLESNKALIAPHARLIYAAALILLSQESRAADILDELPLILHPSDVPYCNLLRESLRQGLDVARALLDQVKEKNLRTFGLA